MKKTRCLIAMVAITFYVTACGDNQNGSNSTDTASANSGYNSSGTATGTGSDTTIGANSTDTGKMDATGHHRDTSRH